MNLPNLLTLIRMALVPVFIVLFYFGQAGSRAFCVFALIVFAAASATDALDGHIARKHGLITNFGKLMDPLADKVLTTSAFIVFVDVGIVPAWMVIVIIAREFAITGLRGVAAAEGAIIAAGFSGKLKTIFQMVAICLILLDSAIGNGPATHSLWVVASGAGLVCLWIAVALTVYSGAEYLWNGRKLLNMK
jgi:CDP-diacylglycerol--glycerol-3-phosphate 3-phosphatidyltransferase/cardiolipin synthase